VGRIGSITGLTFESCPRQYSGAKEAVQDYIVSPADFCLCFELSACPPPYEWRSRNIYIQVDMNLSSCIKEMN
jgi:hypothetical protein